MKLSIKAKIILWFTLFFAILTASTIVFLSSVSNTIVESEVSESIKEETSDVLEHLVVYPDGPFYLEEIEETGEDTFELEPFQYFKDEIAFLIYKNNTLQYGQYPSGVNTLPSIQLQTVQVYNTDTERYMMYDVPIDSDYVLRSIQNISNSENVIQTIINQLLWFGPILILVSSIGGYFILKNSFKPIKVLYKTAETIKDEQDYSKRIPLNQTKDELYHMGDMINQMIASMEVSLKREQAFTSNVSHELRTPIAVLKAQIEYLQAKLLKTSYQEDMKEIVMQLEQVEQIVEQLLMFSKFEHIQELDFQDIHLNQLIETVTESFEESLKLEDISLHLDLKNYIHIQANEIAIIRILNNVISNAIKYNKKHGKIIISTDQKDKNVIIQIEDHGIGISKDNLKKVFDPFFREDTARGTHDLHLGIGLSMVKRLIELHKGTITIESQSGQFTIVTLTLPIKNTR